MEPWLAAGTHTTPGHEGKAQLWRGWGRSPQSRTEYIFKECQYPRQNSCFQWWESPTESLWLRGSHKKGKQIPSAGLLATPVSFQMKWSEVLSRHFRYNSCPQHLVITMTWGQGLGIVTPSINIPGPPWEHALPRFSPSPLRNLMKLEMEEGDGKAKASTNRGRDECVSCLF